MIATVAVDVCTRPCVSVLGTRCTRCTPLSYFIFEKTLSPFTSSVTLLYPPSVPWLSSMMRVFHPSACAYLRYAPRMSPAQIAASSPPVPART